jgi:hypothetical protein
MFSVDQAPRYEQETRAAAARLQEMASPERYGALVRRAERTLEGMFTVETMVEPELQVKIAIRERFEAARVKQAILMVATGRLFRSLAASWDTRGTTALPSALAERRLAGARS